MAWFSPIPPVRTGVAEYSEELLPYLEEYMDLELFVEDPELHRGTKLAKRFAISDYRDYGRRKKATGYDVNIYQMGNSLAHRFVYHALVEMPGLAVLHEPMLHHFMLEMLQADWTLYDYRRELVYNYGALGGEIERIVAADGTELSRFEYPMIQRVVDCSLGLMVHSEYARREVMKHHPRGPVEVVGHAYVPDPSVSGLSREEARRRVDLPSEAFIVGTFGFVTPSKRIEQILEAFELFARECREARLLIAGGTLPGYPVAEIVRSKGLHGRILITGYTGWQELLTYMAAVDVAVALRFPSAGETPGSLIRLLGMGKPTVVSDHKAFSEFPDGVCMKVDPGDEVGALLDDLMFAYRDPGAAASMGEAARRFIAENNDVRKIAASYAEFAVRVLSGAAPVISGMEGFEGAIRSNLLEEISDKISSMGVGEGCAGLLEELSASLSAVLSGAGR